MNAMPEVTCRHAFLDHIMRWGFNLVPHQTHAARCSRAQLQVVEVLRKRAHQSHAARCSRALLQVVEVPRESRNQQ